MCEERVRRGEEVQSAISPLKGPLPNPRQTSNPWGIANCLPPLLIPGLGLGKMLLLTLTLTVPCATAPGWREAALVPGRRQRRGGCTGPRVPRGQRAGDLPQASRQAVGLHRSMKGATINITSSFQQRMGFTMYIAFLQAQHAACLCAHLMKISCMSTSTCSGAGLNYL